MSVHRHLSWPKGVCWGSLLLGAGAYRHSYFRCRWYHHEKPRILALSLSCRGIHAQVQTSALQCRWGQAWPCWVKAEFWMRVTRWWSPHALLRASYTHPSPLSGKFFLGPSLHGCWTLHHSWRCPTSLLQVDPPGSGRPFLPQPDYGRSWDPGSTTDTYVTSPTWWLQDNINTIKVSDMVNMFALNRQ